MPHPYPDALKSHLQQSRITVAVRARITRRDGVLLGLTSHVKSQTIGGLLHHATPGMMSSALVSRGDTSIDNASLTGFLTPDVIDESDLRAGAYDEALVEFDVYNYNDIGMGLGFLGKGYLGGVKFSSDGTFGAEFRSLEQMLASEIGETTSSRCRNRGLCNGTCPVNRNGVDNLGRPITTTGTVGAVTSGDWGYFESSAVATLPDNFFRRGVLTWTGGRNTGFKGEIFSSQGSQIRSWQPFPFPIQVGDAFSMLRGCDLRFETCKGEFSNHNAPLYFNGEPHVQGLDLFKIVQADS